MPIVPIFGTGQTGKSLTVTAQRHLNIYAEATDEKKLAFYGTPGTTLRVSFGDTPVRGWIAVGDLYYVVHRGTFYSVNNAGTKTAIGSALSTTSGRVGMAYDGSVILITTGTNGYTYTVATNTLALVSDSDYPDAANTCTWLGGWFVVDDGVSDSFYISENGVDWNALDFATAESNPDGLVRVFSDNGEIILGGEQTIEFWGDIGAADFPFAAVKGATVEFGIAARWSMVKFNSGVAALMKPKMGQVQVMFIQGYTPRVLSSPEMDSIINGYATVSDATFYAYMLGGHPMLQCNFPSAGKSWLYDALTNMWSPLEYGLNGGRHRGEIHLDFLNKPIIADYENGNIYELDPDVFTDNGTAIAREIVGRHFFVNNDRIICDELFLDMEVGVGLTSGQGSDPQVMLQISKNNGKTWGAELWTALGALGNYLTRVHWHRLGLARDWTFRIRVTDPIKFVLTFACMDVRK
jgi:hypothetical protein